MPAELAFRDSHAFLGVKGADAGTAIQRHGACPVRITIDHPRPPARMTLSNFQLQQTASRPEKQRPVADH